MRWRTDLVASHTRRLRGLRHHTSTASIGDPIQKNRGQFRMRGGGGPAAPDSDRPGALLQQVMACSCHVSTHSSFLPWCLLALLHLLTAPSRSLAGPVRPAHISSTPSANGSASCSQTLRRSLRASSIPLSPARPAGAVSVPRLRGWGPMTSCEVSTILQGGGRGLRPCRQGGN